MRLFTHNLLKCHVRNCTKDSFPLRIEDAELAVKSAEYRPDFLAMQMCKVDYEALLKTAQEVIRLYFPC
jgi:multifunctional methyltransferase subunit TRM112